MFYILKAFLPTNLFSPRAIWHPLEFMTWSSLCDKPPSRGHPQVSSERPRPAPRRGLAAGSRAPPSASAATLARSGATLGSGAGERGLGAGACRSASGQLPGPPGRLRSLGLPGARALRLRFPDATSVINPG